MNAQPFVAPGPFRYSSRMTRHPLDKHAVRSFLCLNLAHIGECFNDQAFKIWLITIGPALYLAARGIDAASVPLHEMQALTTRISSFGNALFLVPYVIFSPFAGPLADRFSKRNTQIGLKFFELFVMSMGATAIMTESLVMGFVAVFLLALHSALLTPPKMGLLCELFDETKIAWANGIINMTYSVTALVSAVVGSAVFANKAVCPPWAAGAVFIGMVLMGLAAAFGVQHRPAAAPEVPVLANPYGMLWRTSLMMWRNARLRYATLGNIFFWVLAQIIFIFLIGFARGFAGPELESSSAVGLLLTCLTLGIGAGSVLAGYLSGGRIELGFVPLGALGMGLAALDLGLAEGGLWRAAMDFIVLGAAGGFFIVPLAAQLQDASPDDCRGRVLASESFVRNTIMFGSALTCMFLLTETAPREIFRWVGFVSIGVTVYIVALIPDWVLRLVVWVIAHTLYDIRIFGRDNLPDYGPALIVPNHVTWMDGPLLLAALNRNIRFVAHDSFFARPVLGRLLRLMRAIPVSTEASPWANLRSLKKAREFLDAGELVVVFAEGQLTRTGNLARFKQGVEYIVQHTAHPVIPAYIDRAWGSIFSFRGGRFFWKWPVRFPYPIRLSFGAPLGATTTAAQIRDAVSQLSSQAFDRRAREMRSLGRQLAAAAKSHWYAPCLSDASGKQLTAGRTLTGALLLARAWRTVCPNEARIGLFMPPSVGCALANFSLALCGRTSVNLNYTLSQEVLDEVTARAGLKTVITARSFLDKVVLKPKVKLIYLEDLVAIFTTVQKLATGILAYSLPAGWVCSWLAGGPPTGPDDVATIMFTSGSTNRPKGVLLTHANILSNVAGFLEVLSFDTNDSVAGVLPFFHVFGYTTALWAPMLAGGQAAFHPNPLDAAGVGELVRTRRLTILMAAPTFYLLYVRKCKPEDFASLRLAVAGAEKLRPELGEKFKQKFGLPLREGYGSTELSPVAAVNIPDAEVLPGLIHIGTKPGTIGQPLPGVHVRIAHPDTLEPLPFNQDGLLLVSGPNVMKGYLDDPQSTAEAMHGQWYVTGDIGRMDEDGFITITDRLSRFAKIGGEKVPLIKVEEAIQQAAGTDDRVVVVCAVPDEHKGERLIALYLKNGLVPSEITAAMRAQGVPNLFIPRPDDFHAVEQFPLLGSGKLDLKAAKQLALERAGKAS